MKLKIFSSSFARKSFSNSAKQRIETINTKLPRIRENRTFINRAIYIINEKKKKKKDYLEHNWLPGIERCLRRNWREKQDGLHPSVREREKKKRRGKEKKSGKIGSLELSRGNQIFEEQKREKGELACSLLFGWKIVIVHGKSVRFSGQSGG